MVSTTELSRAVYLIAQLSLLARKNKLKSPDGKSYVLLYHIKLKNMVNHSRDIFMALADAEMTEDYTNLSKLLLKFKMIGLSEMTSKIRPNGQAKKLARL